MEGELTGLVAGVDRFGGCKSNVGFYLRLAPCSQKIHFHTLRRVSYCCSKGVEMRIGYARVSTTEQNLDLQRDALKRAGCEKIIEDTASGGKRATPRPGAGAGYAAIWRCAGGLAARPAGAVAQTPDRADGRAGGKRIGFQSVTESIDTTTPGGKLVFHIFGALAEFERNLIRERTHAGLAAARARGRKGGRRKKLGEKQRAVAVDLYRQKKHKLMKSARQSAVGNNFVGHHSSNQAGTTRDTQMAHSR